VKFLKIADAKTKDFAKEGNFDATVALTNSMDGAADADGAAAMDGAADAADFATK
jgi:hypothetical protein